MHKRQLKYFLPAAFLGLVTVSAVIARHAVNLPQKVKVDVGNEQIPATAAEVVKEATNLNVTVDGQPVPVRNGSVHMLLDDGTSVTVSGDTTTSTSGQGSVEMTNQDGSVSVSVTSNSTNSSKGSSTRTRDSSSTNSTTRSTTNVTSRGTGNVNVSH